MSRDGSGNYTLPVGNPVVSGTIIDVNWANPTMADIAQQLNNVVTRDGVLGPLVPIGAIDGTQALPGVSFKLAPGTGLWREAAKAGYSYNGVAAWYKDSTGLVVPSNITVNSVNSGPLAGFRNYLINGDFSVWQHGIADTSLSTGYMADMWSHSYSQSALVSRQAFTASGSHPGDSTHVLRASGDATATTSRISVGQCVEGINSIPLRGKTVTLGFYVRFSAAVIAAGVPGTWTAIIGYGIGTADAGFQSTNLIGVAINAVQIAQGALPAVWTKYSGQFTIGANATNVAVYFQFSNLADLATTDYYELSQVQLEIGSVATPFEFRPYSVELALCQRYYQQYAAEITINAYGHVRVDAMSFWPVQMRASPTMGSAGITYVNSSGYTDNGSNMSVWRRYMTATAAGLAYLSGGIVTASAEL